MQHTKKKSDVGSAAKPTVAATPSAQQNNLPQQTPRQNLAAANPANPSPVAKQPAPAVPKQEPKEPAINTNPQKAVAQNMMANLMSSDAAVLNAITIKKEPEKAEDKKPSPTLLEDFTHKNPEISELQKKFNLKPC